MIFFSKLKNRRGKNSWPANVKLLDQKQSDVLLEKATLAAEEAAKMKKKDDKEDGDEEKKDGKGAKEEKKDEKKVESPCLFYPLSNGIMCSPTFPTTTRTMTRTMCSRQRHPVTPRSKH